MPNFCEIKRVFFSETNPLSNLPFPNSLGSTGSIDLGQIFVCSSRGENSFILNGVVNWSATFTGLPVPAAAAVPGFAIVSFEIFKDGAIIYRVTDTIGQPNFNFRQAFPETTFTGTSTAFKTTKLTHAAVDVCPVIKGRVSFFTISANVVSLVPPLTDATTPAGTATVSFGPVVLTVEQVGKSR